MLKKFSKFHCSKSVRCLTEPENEDEIDYRFFNSKLGITKYVPATSIDNAKGKLKEYISRTKEGRFEDYKYMYSTI